ncbi:protein PAL OF QUIRKY isoform X2 [Apium graveolens]|uniref:protein PAL OF QUIRKY isoform X2 n=1 Tax=Apium graveolens TaxID=4045 RepID=UPI003D7BAA5C
MDTSPPALPPLPNTKLRLMVSYGGQIIPRADKKSLFYSSGETRIVAVDRRTNLAAFMAHLSRTVFNNRPFVLKYQIPSEDIDSLISVTSDEDLINMFEEHERAVSSASGPARIRLFLFPTKPESVGTVLLDPKSESWFNDALKSSMMIRGQSEDVGNGILGFDGLGLLESDGGKNGLMEFGSESMVLENNSSFGSTGSSTSMPTIGAFGEEDKKKVTVASSGSLDSLASAVSHPKTGFHQDQAVHISSSDAKVSSNAVKPESVILEPSSLIQMKNAAQVSSYQLPPAPEEKLHQQVQYIHSGGHYVSQYPTGPLPFSSYYPVYQPQIHQQHVPYPSNPPNPPYPIYLLPVRPNQSYNMSASHNLNIAATIAPSRPPLHPQTSLLSNQVAYKEVTPAPVLPELTSDGYWSTAPSVQKQQLLDPLESYQPSHPVASDPLVTTNSDAEIVVDDLAYAQIYKSQPPAPATTPPYEAMTNTSKVLASETSTPLHGTSLQSKRPNV